MHEYEAEDDYYPFEGNHPQAAGQEEESQDLSDEDDDWDSEIFYEVECPNCGNRDQNKMNVARRTCGYIGTQFWNQGRTQEIKERVLHL